MSSLVMSNGGPRDRFVDQYLTLMIFFFLHMGADTYIYHDIFQLLLFLRHFVVFLQNPA